MDTDDLGRILEEIAPCSLAESWDNVGWQVRVPGQTVSGILLTLDVTLGVLEEAATLGCNLIFAHHPTFFRPVSSLDLASPLGSVIGGIIRNGMSVWAAHTNLDVLPDGTSFALARALGLAAPEVLARVERNVAYDPLLPANRSSGFGFGAVGSLPNRSRTDRIARDAAKRLASGVCQVAGDPRRLHERVAVVGGSGGSLIGDAVRSGATLCITADLGYHRVQDAVARGLDVVVLDHYATEYPVLDSVRLKLEKRLPGLTVRVATTPTTPFVSVKI